MYLKDFINENTKKCGRWCYVPYNFFILRQYEFSEEQLKSWAEEVTNKHKLIVYKLTDNVIAVIRFSYPNTYYRISLYKDGRKKKIASRSREVLKWWFDYVNNIYPSNANICKNTCKTFTSPKALKDLPDNTELLSYKVTSLVPHEALDKYWLHSEKTLLSPASAEFKKPRSKQQCVIDVCNTAIAMQKFLGSDYKDITLGDIDHLALLRFKANPKIKGT